MGRKSRDKGKRGEREAAAEIRRILRTEAHRGRQYCGSDESPDIVTGIEGIHWEVKRAETLQLYNAVEQAVCDAGEQVSVVLHRQNNKPWVAIVRLEDLPRLAIPIYLHLAATA